MTFVKVLKNKAYFKRFQVKYRRRRDGKTDYQARRALITQEKNKYNTPKYRMVVRFSNRDIITQVVVAKVEGDHVLCSAYAHELPSYGLPGQLGLTNYAAAYATGLLLARRTLTKLGLNDIYKGNQEINGEDYTVATTDEAMAQDEAKEEGEGKRPFRVILDTGLVRTSTGARVFGAMKGACDGGLDIPHKTTRFPGATKEGYDAEVHRNYIFGEHVADYMRNMIEEDPTGFDRQFARWKAAKIGPDSVEGMYEKLHAAIRKSPAKVAKARKPPATKRTKRGKLSAPQKKANAQQRLANLRRNAA
jgi:large subunit ribosomal protein L5e